MPMFEELFALASEATLTLIVSAEAKDGRMTVSVIPKPKADNGEVGLRQPLSLTATPQEFDAGFVDALRGYREVRASLAEQAAATREVLEAAKSASVKKASDAVSKASAKGAKPASPTSAKPPAAVPATGEAPAVPSGEAPEAAAQPQVPDLFG
ncbi:PRTRC system protein E [Luteimonas sp. BDR2-5]|uniref:PRTRC system protein E n=1 Tax=Proluteimonas luteida TaxID=2878685 RepID=UPI001E3CB9C5|nr:PRTRC system protein E [Luteimonas sp. BDR2-5]MCD9026821.1 PRTRC system protein E [Luteimonas sp. BDR2-5]